MQAELGALDTALADGDPVAARAAVAGIDPGDADVLDHLARAAARPGPTGTTRLATELLIERLDASGVVRAFAARALLDPAAVDDVAQDSLISIATSITSFAGASRVTTWAHRIVRNRVADHLRRQRATAPLPPDDLAPGERMSSMIATRESVRRVLADLPDLYREPVTLRDLDGLGYAQIAERLDRSLAAVKSQVARGRAMVAAAFPEYVP